eukprot:TRINITY_DN1094_c0_g2_i1.p1 TRINITY_DN1094_c0_g2~~TRINITY_DN1094_c0_g2_i1.p1  ORF type:complete len:134 (-),score=10.16 TRINITY_DN1094_c0_g2_i1:33-434(-)
MEFPYPTSGALRCDVLTGISNHMFIAEPGKCSGVVALDEAHAKNPNVPLYSTYGANTLASHRGTSPVGTWNLWVYDDEVLDATTIQSFSIEVTYMPVPIVPSQLCGSMVCSRAPLAGYLSPLANAWTSGTCQS